MSFCNPALALPQPRKVRRRSEFKPFRLLPLRDIDRL
jgi:hypothetical protein